jgi:hypothetical protein
VASVCDEAVELKGMLERAGWLLLLLRGAVVGSGVDGAERGRSGLSSGGPRSSVERQAAGRREMNDQREEGCLRLRGWSR